MGWPFVSRARYEALEADRERLRGERDQFLKDRNSFKYAAESAARQFTEADATNRRLAGRVLELNVRLSAYAESDPDYVACLERRIACLQQGVARYLPALWKVRKELAKSTEVEGALARQIHELAQPVEPTDDEMDSINRLIRERDSEKKRADHLQKRLDQATGLDSAPVAAGVGWQDRREKKMRFDK
ncbi:hypothetical protein [Streptomyces antibioticus]|uniref:hypothetical protein n=1 Tax=Streptomyces antibioticus TaxID=1890 RepID=UPI0033FE7DFC